MEAKKVVRWQGRRIDHQTIRFSLRAALRDGGTEIGAYRRWDNPRAEAASEPIAAVIEQRARDQGYEVGEEPWWDLDDR
jgi:hypothetical protein